MYQVMGAALPHIPCRPTIITLTLNPPCPCPAHLEEDKEEVLLLVRGR